MSWFTTITFSQMSYFWAATLLKCYIFKPRHPKWIKKRVLRALIRYPQNQGNANLNLRLSFFRLGLIDARGFVFVFNSFP
jgi:hypothetical protein